MDAKTAFVKVFAFLGFDINEDCISDFIQKGASAPRVAHRQHLLHHDVRQVVRQLLPRLRAQRHSRHVTQQLAVHVAVLVRRRVQLLLVRLKRLVQELVLRLLVLQGRLVLRFRLHLLVLHHALHQHTRTQPLVHVARRLAQQHPNNNPLIVVHVVMLYTAHEWMPVGWYHCLELHACFALKRVVCKSEHATRASKRKGVSGALKLGNKGVAAILVLVAESQRSGHTLEGFDIMPSTIVNVEQADTENVTRREIDNILEMLCTFDWPHLIQAMVEHPYLSQLLRDQTTQHQPHPHVDDTAHLMRPTSFRPLEGTLKKAIRTGKLKVLTYLIDQDTIPIQLLDAAHYESDLKSMVFNILRAVQIGANKARASDCFLCAERFWPYLAAKVNRRELSGMNVKDSGLAESRALRKVMSEDKEDGGEDGQQVSNLKAMNEHRLVIEHMNKFVRTMFYSNKKISATQLTDIYAVLQFQRERHILFVSRDWNSSCNGNTWRRLVHLLMDGYGKDSRRWTCRKCAMKNKLASDKCVACDVTRSHVVKDADIGDVELELTIIAYLLAGGVLDGDEIDVPRLSRCDADMVRAIVCGQNDWRLRQSNRETIETIMPPMLPLEICKLVIGPRVGSVLEFLQ